MNNYYERNENNNEIQKMLQNPKSQEIVNESNENNKEFLKSESNIFAKNHYRITGYCPEHNFSFIIDSNGMFEKLWQFSAYLISKDLKVIEVSKLENIIDINIIPAEEDTQHLILRATSDGKPQIIK